MWLPEVENLELQQCPDDDPRAQCDYQGSGAQGECPEKGVFAEGGALEQPGGMNDQDTNEYQDGGQSQAEG